MSRDPYRSSTGDVGRNDRWDRDRFLYERDRERDQGGSRYTEREVRYEEDDHVYTRPAPPAPGPPPRRRPYDDDVVYQNRRVYYDDEPPRFAPRRPSPPGSDAGRRVVFEKEREREREVVRSPSPPRMRRPGTLLRRQSSLDTFDRKPKGFYEREEYGPPARREDFRPPLNTPIPLPRSKALPPPRRYAEREYHDEIRVSDPDYYGDEDFHNYPTERVREKEVIRTRRRSRSRESRASRARSHRPRSRSSSRTSTSSSSSSATTTTVRSEYPKKGKTRIPSRLVSKRALIDLGYPFVDEGNTIVVQRALGQEDIDDLLKVSEDYKKAELEVQAGDLIQERRQEVVVYPPAPQPGIPVAAPPPPPPAWATAPPPGPAPMIVNTSPPIQQVQTTTLVRDVSPARSYTTSTSYMTDTTYTTDVAPYVVNAGPMNQQVALVETGRHRSRSRGHHHHSSRDLVKAERLPTGELVLYEETIERVEEPNRGVRIERDKKGRMSISVPKYPRV